MTDPQTMSKITNTYPNVLQMLRNIPKDLRHIFVPLGMTFQDLTFLNINISKRKAIDADRDMVMAIQRASEFPLRPNASLREVIIKSKIQGFKKGLTRPPNEQNQDGDTIQ